LIPEINKFDFIPLIKERKIEHGYGMNSHVDLGEGFVISIQASSGHYSNPRKTLELLTDYDEFEILIYYNNKGTIVVNEDVTSSDYETYLDDVDYSVIKHCGAYVIGGTPVSGYLSGFKIDSIINTIKSIVSTMNSRTVLFEKSLFPTSTYMYFLKK